MPLLNYEIKPYKGIGQIKLGMTPEQVHEITGVSEYTDEYSNTIFEFYDKYPGLSIQYDAKIKGCIAISMGRSTDPVYLGRHLMHEPWKTASKWLRQIDSHIEKIDIGLIGHDTGIHLAHEKLELPRNNIMRRVDVVNVVIVFAKGYWDRPVTDLPIDEEKLARFDNGDDPYDLSLYF